MNTAITPSSIAPPAANYAHAVATTGATRWLHTSGVVPVRPDGSVPDDVAEQADVVWANIAAMLADAEMVPGDIVSVTTYVVAVEASSEMAERLSTVMARRDRFMQGLVAASTLVTVPMLARPQWWVEVAVIAAR